MILNPPQLSFKRERLAPSETRRIAISGESLWVLEATFGVYAQFGDTDEIPLDLGFDVRLPFESLTLRNPSETKSATIDFVYGTGEFRDGRFNIVSTRAGQFVLFQHASTVALASRALTSLANAAKDDFSGEAEVDESGITLHGQRKAIIICNSDPLLPLSVQLPTDMIEETYATTAQIGPQRSFIMETASPVRIKNESGGPIICGVTEIFYRT